MKFTLSAIYIFLFFSCGTAQQKKEVLPKDSTSTEINTLSMTLPADTIITIGKTPIWIKSPKGEIKADLLILPGWNFSKEKICNESDFCEKALVKGYRLILPEMGKSVYASEYYPETRNDYKKLLTLTWVTDTMIPALQKDYQIFTGKNNYLHGISTGARGAALVHLTTGKLFSKVILLSGDYDQTQLTKDNLMTNTYGPYEKFKERWETVDNPIHLAANWSAQLYIAHGTEDEVVPTEQSKDFSKSIAHLHPQLKLVSHFPTAKHDFIFWGGETEKVLKFLEE
jgi:esterase/lipase superfamily enzyme